jgi:hypothetical protein
MVARHVVIDEFHLTVTTPPGTPPDELDAVQQILDREGFQRDLRRAARRVFRRHGLGEKVKVRLSR